jgi:hypothetical protein
MLLDGKKNKHIKVNKRETTNDDLIETSIVCFSIQNHPETQRNKHIKVNKRETTNDDLIETSIVCFFHPESSRNTGKQLYQSEQTRNDK